MNRFDIEKISRMAKLDPCDPMLPDIGRDMETILGFFRSIREYALPQDSGTGRIADPLPEMRTLPVSPPEERLRIVEGFPATDNGEIRLPESMFGNENGK